MRQADGSRIGYTPRKKPWASVPSG
jgi:hypothetical protein